MPREHPLNREWALICEGHDFALCLTGWEPPGSGDGREGTRRFEAIWTVEPEVEREVPRICCAIAAARCPAVAETAWARLEAPLSAAPESQLRLASAVTPRMLSHVRRDRIGELGIVRASTEELHVSISKMPSISIAIP